MVERSMSKEIEAKTIKESLDGFWYSKRNRKSNISIDYIRENGVVVWHRLFGDLVYNQDTDYEYPFMDDYDSVTSFVKLSDYGLFKDSDGRFYVLENPNNGNSKIACIHPQIMYNMWKDGLIKISHPRYKNYAWIEFKD